MGKYYVLKSGIRYIKGIELIGFKIVPTITYDKEEALRMLRSDADRVNQYLMVFHLYKYEIVDVEDLEDE